MTFNTLHAYGAYPMTLWDNLSWLFLKLVPRAV